MAEFKLELYKDWTPEQLKQRCRTLLRAMGEREEIIKRIWTVTHRPSKDHPKGSHAYSHFMADFDEIRNLCQPIVAPYLDDADAQS
ncbi:MAG: hypothetical protein JWQ03_3131 [Variovorax sp.]|nr:hypothetical protein [Variovorax sp.]